MTFYSRDLWVTGHRSQITDHYSLHGGVGRWCGVGRGRGVALGVALGVGVIVGVALGVAVGLGVGVGVIVAVGVGVAPCAYLIVT
jgi:hypothetical protein